MKTHDVKWQLLRNFCLQPYIKRVLVRVRERERGAICPTSHSAEVRSKGTSLELVFSFIENTSSNEELQCMPNN